MRIGLDLDGTLYAHPVFFAAMIEAMHTAGHTFFCTSSHGREQWERDDVPRLRALGIPAELINPSLLEPLQHANLTLKGKAADKCDVVFDDDPNLNRHTKALVLVPLGK